MLTEDGFEMQLGVNPLGHVLLTMMLLVVDKTQASAPSRIINVASLAHILCSVNFEDLNSEKSYSLVRAYRQSKLANVLFTRELAQRQWRDGELSVCIPALQCHTNLLRHSIFSHCSLLVAPVVRATFKTPVQGAQTTLYCALASDLEGVTGRYFSDCREKEAWKESKNEDAAKRLWDISEKWTGLV